MLWKGDRQGIDCVESASQSGRKEFAMRGAGKTHVPMALVEFVKKHERFAQQALPTAKRLRDEQKDGSLARSVLRNAVNQLRAVRKDWFLRSIATLRTQQGEQAIECKLGAVQDARHGPLAHRRCFTDGERRFKRLVRRMPPEQAAQYVFLQGAFRPRPIAGIESRGGDVQAFVKGVRAAADRLRVGLTALGKWSSAMIANIECDVDMRGDDRVLVHAHVVLAVTPNKLRRTREKLLTVIRASPKFGELVDVGLISEERVPILLLHGVDTELTNSKSTFHRVQYEGLRDRVMYSCGLRKLSGLRRVGRETLRPESLFRLKVMELPSPRSGSKSPERELAFALINRVVAEMAIRHQKRTVFTYGRWLRNELGKGSRTSSDQIARKVARSLRADVEAYQTRLNAWAKQDREGRRAVEE